MTYIQLTYWDLAIASLFLLVNGAVSLVFNLGIERTLLLSGLRMVVQLGAIGFVLKFIFAQTSPVWTFALAVVMILVAGREVMARQSLVFKGLASYGLSTTTLFFVGLVGTMVGVGLLIRPEPWYAPRYILPVLGMMLGNTMSGIALSMETLTISAKREQSAIEAHLAMGADRFEALRSAHRQSLRTGMMPIINAMAASGIVSIPGMMTGQILSGVDPVEATKYQLLIMFLIAGGTAFGVLMASFGGVYLLTDERHRLRIDRFKVE